MPWVTFWGVDTAESATVLPFQVPENAGGAGPVVVVAGAVVVVLDEVVVVGAVVVVVVVGGVVVVVVAEGAVEAGPAAVDFCGGARPSRAASIWGVLPSMPRAQIPMPSNLKVWAIWATR